MLETGTVNDNNNASMTSGTREKDEIGPGTGIINFLKRFWYHLIVVFIGGKWSLIETFTRHKKLDPDEIPKRHTGKTVVITGGARGIGAEVVKQCLQLDMHVIIGCRKPSAGHDLIKKLRDDGVTAGTVEAFPLDLNSLDSVRQFAQTVLHKNIPIHILINNAGVMFLPFQVTQDGYESQFQTNYLSHFLLTLLLVPALNSAGTPDMPSRIINVSSAAQYGGQIDFNNIDMKCKYSPHMGYMSSKLMQVISTVDLSKRFQEEKLNIRVFSLHPGVVRTDLYQNVWWVNFFGKLLNIMFKTPEQGADGIMYLAMSPNVINEGSFFYANCNANPVNPLALSREVQQNLYSLSKEMCGASKTGEANDKVGIQFD